MKKLWLVYLDGQYLDSVYERTEEEALAAARAIHHPPEDEGELYPGDSVMTLTVEEVSKL